MFYIFGEVFFATTQKRNKAAARMDTLAASYGFTPGAAPEYGEAWPDGRVLITGTADSGASVPGIRFGYQTATAEAMQAATVDIAGAWDVFGDTDSWWGSSQS